MGSLQVGARCRVLGARCTWCLAIACFAATAQAQTKVPRTPDGRHWLGDVRVRGESANPARPLFIGAEPSTVKFTVEHAPPVGYRNLAEEEDLARALLASFSPEQKAVAVLQR